MHLLTHQGLQNIRMLLYDYIPPRLPRPGHTYLCVVLHGLGDSKEGWKPVAPMLHLEQVGFIFVQAPMPYGPGWSWFDINLNGPIRVNQAQVIAGRQLIDDLVDHLLEKYQLPASNLFILGFSQGCLMAIDWGLRRAERIAGIVGISGSLTLLNEFPAAFGVSSPTQALLMTHGLYDQVIPITTTRPLKDSLIALGAACDWREYEKDHGLDPDRELPDIHRWMVDRMRATS